MGRLGGFWLTVSARLFPPVANLVVNDRRFSLSSQGFNNLELPVRHLLSICIKARKTNESVVEKIARQNNKLDDTTIRGMLELQLMHLNR